MLAQQVGLAARAQHLHDRRVSQHNQARLIDDQQAIRRELDHTRQLAPFGQQAPVAVEPHDRLDTRAQLDRDRMAWRQNHRRRPRYRASARLRSSSAVSRMIGTSPSSGIGAYPPADLEAIQPRHHHIQQYQVGLDRRCLAQRLGAIGGERQLVALRDAAAPPASRARPARHPQSGSSWPNSSDLRCATQRRRLGMLVGSYALRERYADLHVDARPRLTIADPARPADPPEQARHHRQAQPHPRHLASEEALALVIGQPRPRQLVGRERQPIVADMQLERVVD